LSILAEGLSALAAGMGPREAAAVCARAAATHSQAMTRTNDPYALYYLVQGLSAVASRLESREAATAAATLSQAMTGTTDPYALRVLAQGLSALAARMGPREASAICARAATLSQAMIGTTDPNALRVLAQGLSALAAGLEPREAADVCAQATATLTQAMTRTIDPDLLRLLAQGLSMVLCREDPITSKRQPLAVVSTVVGVSGPSSLLTAPALMQPALEPPPVLPAQTLVDLLKQPLCVGAARRLVLDQLSRHYQRPFADQWDFVDYVQQQQLGLDLTTPPARSRMLPQAAPKPAPLPEAKPDQN
jgi:hypothetical protein